MLFDILEQSLIFFPLALGIYISYVVLKIPDLTTDGSFILGGAAFALSVRSGSPPSIALLTAAGAGMVAGMAVSFLQTRLSLNPLIAGILLVFILNSLTLKLMGKPNLSLLDQPSLWADEGTKMKILLAIAFVSIFCGGLLLTSRLGLTLYALGESPVLLGLCGKNAAAYRTVGLSLSNGLVGFCGALTAGASGYADIGMGTGIILIALAAVIMGQQLYRFCLKKQTFAAKFFELAFCWIGVVSYFGAVHLLLVLRLDPIYLRMMIGLCLIGFLAMTRNQQLLRSQHG